MSSMMESLIGKMLGIMSLLKTVKYLYEILLERGGYREQSTFFKPFYALLILWMCVLLAIPVCTAILKITETDGIYKEK